MKDTGYGGGLYNDIALESQRPAAAAASPSSGDTGSAAPSSSSVSDALIADLELIAAPATLLADVEGAILTPGSTSKLPQGLAILGACAVAVIWAASLQPPKGKRE